MKEVILRLAIAVVLAAALVGIGTLAGGISQAQPVNGDLLLDWETSDNTDTSVGTVDTGCRSFSAGAVVRIDVIAVSASDWAGMDFVFDYPSPAVVERPGPGDGVDTSQGQVAGDQATFAAVVVDPAAGFDFVPFDGATAPTFGPNNLLSTGGGSSMTYNVTDVVPDGSAPHGISAFDNALVGESGDGGIARLSLDTTGLATGVYTLSLGVTGGFAGGVHSDSPPTQFLPDNFGSVQMAIGGCPGEGPGRAAGKTEICHRAANWVFIEVNDNALDAHLGVHTDGADFDEEISETECLARNS